jgi:uncharacterized protein
MQLQVLQILTKLPGVSHLVRLLGGSGPNGLESWADALPRHIDIVAAIPLEALIAAQIRGIILDLDNTIVSEDDRYLSPGAVDWIAKAHAMGLKMFILSNGKRRYRVEYWSDYLDIPAVNPAKKPFPAGFRKAFAQMQLPASQVVVIGDSRHTDVFGAWLAGCPCIQVASLPHPPLWWEKILGRYVQIPYPKDQELWDFQPQNYSNNR